MHDDPLPPSITAAIARAKTPAERHQLERNYRAMREQKRAKETAPAPASVIAPDEKKKSKSKKNLVPKLPANWRQRVFAGTETARAPSMLRKSVAILWLTGCRPSEIEKGVEVKISGNEIGILIAGAKVGEIDNGVTKAKRGIEKRLLVISKNQNEASELMFKLASEAGGRLRIKYDAVALLNKVSEIGKKALKKKGVSPYCFRHAMASDLKSCDALDDTQRAQILGHLSVESLAAYGRRRRGGGGPAPVQRVKTTQQPHGQRSTPPAPAAVEPTARPRG